MPTVTHSLVHEKTIQRKNISQPKGRYLHTKYFRVVNFKTAFQGHLSHSLHQFIYGRFLTCNSVIPHLEADRAFLTVNYQMAPPQQSVLSSHSKNISMDILFVSYSFLSHQPSNSKGHN